MATHGPHPAKEGEGMSIFRVGMKVVCIADSVDKINDLGLPGFKKGEVLTITRMTHREPYGLFLSFCERDPRQAAHHVGFRPVVERKTSIEVFKAMLNKPRVTVSA